MLLRVRIAGIEGMAVWRVLSGKRILYLAERVAIRLDVVHDSVLILRNLGVRCLGILNRGIAPDSTVLVGLSHLGPYQCKGVA